MVENNVSFFYLALVYTIPLTIGSLAAAALIVYLWRHLSNGGPGRRGGFFTPFLMTGTAVLCLGYVFDDITGVVRPFLNTAINMCESARASAGVKKSLSDPPKRISLPVVIENCLSCYFPFLRDYSDTTFVVYGLSSPQRRWSSQDLARFKFVPPSGGLELSLGSADDPACLWPLDSRDWAMESISGRCVIARPISNQPVDAVISSISSKVKTNRMDVSRTVVLATTGSGELLYHGETLYLNGDNSIVLELRHIFGGITNYTCSFGGYPKAALVGIWPKPN